MRNHSGDSTSLGSASFIGRVAQSAEPVLDRRVVVSSTLTSTTISSKTFSPISHRPYDVASSGVAANDGGWERNATPHYFAAAWKDTRCMSVQMAPIRSTG